MTPKSRTNVCQFIEIQVLSRVHRPPFIDIEFITGPEQPLRRCCKLIFNLGRLGTQWRDMRQRLCPWK